MTDATQQQTSSPWDDLARFLDAASRRLVDELLSPKKPPENAERPAASSDFIAMVEMMKVSRSMFLAAVAAGFSERQACHIVGVFMAELTQGGGTSDASDA